MVPSIKQQKLTQFMFHVHLHCTQLLTISQSSSLLLFLLVILVLILVLCAPLPHTEKKIFGTESAKFSYIYWILSSPTNLMFIIGSLLVSFNWSWHYMEWGTKCTRGGMEPIIKPIYMPLLQAWFVSLSLTWISSFTLILIVVIVIFIVKGKFSLRAFHL